MTKILCKKSYRFFKEGEVYLYYTNFGGLNHFVKDSDSDEIMNFRIDEIPDPLLIHNQQYNPYLWAFFYTIEETRELLIDSIVYEESI